MRSQTEQAYKERLLRVLVYIQQHLDEAIALDELARVAHFSPYHFHRLFRGMVQAMYFSMGKRHDYRQALRRVQSPALIIHGEQDVIPERVSRMYADCLPAGRLHVIKNGRTRGGHVPFSDEPERFAAAVSEFLAEKR